jgi:predicted RNase H-like nuclease (RuvC/YqgF family)
MKFKRSHAAVFYTVLLCCGGFAQEQSLGDVARQQRMEKAKNARSASHVITNESISSNAQPEATPTEVTEKKNAEPIPPPEKDFKTSSVRELQANIKQQKQKVAALQADVNALKQRVDDSPTNHYGSCIFGVNYKAQQETCDVPKKSAAEYEKAKAQLEIEQKNLEQMQEAVRRMGYGNAFYDPE